MRCCRPTVKARLAVEQGSVLGWDRYVGPAGRVIGMKTFGASAPLKELQRKFGFEPERVVAAAMEVLDAPEAAGARPRVRNEVSERDGVRR